LGHLGGLKKEKERGGKGNSHRNRIWEKETGLLRKRVGKRNGAATGNVERQLAPRWRETWGIRLGETRGDHQPMKHVYGKGMGQKKSVEGFQPRKKKSRRKGKPAKTNLTPEIIFL